jgi:hypothetical protein
MLAPGLSVEGLPQKQTEALTSRLRRSALATYAESTKNDLLSQAEAAGGGIRTHTGVAEYVASVPRLPVPPRRQPESS